METGSTTTPDISGFSDKRLAEIWCALNRHEWPEDLPKAPGMAWAIMCAISEAIGFKACLREWNRETMTDEDFEYFWRHHRTPRQVTH